MARPILQVIIGSTRPGRAGSAVAGWIIDRAWAQGDFEVEVTDLAELDLPLFDEPDHPRLRRYVHQHTKDWSAVVDRSDAFIWVIPEYNHGFNAATKNAIDYLSQEWQNKPVGIVSYGGSSGGIRAAQMLKQVLAALRMKPVTDLVTIPVVRERMGEDGQVKPTESMEAAAAAMLAELARLTAALPLRAA